MNQEIIFDAWSRADLPFVYLPTQSRNGLVPRWHEGSRWSPRDRTPLKQRYAVATLEGKHDLYWSPLAFNGDRKNHLADGPIRLLYADLDSSDPLGDRMLSPSVAWETSPGSWQGIWWLRKPVTLEIFTLLNQRLTYFTHADLGGWHASKVLRVPGSINWKRGGVQGRVVHNTRALFDPEWLMKKLPAVEGEGTLGDKNIGPAPTTPNKERATFLLSQMGPGIRYMLNRQGDDRSVHLWKTISAIKGQGLSKEDAFHLIWYAPCNKFRPEGRENRLWKDINRAYRP